MSNLPCRVASRTKKRMITDNFIFLVYGFVGSLFKRYALEHAFYENDMQSSHALFSLKLIKII